MINDRPTQYARDVVSGKIVAGPFVRGACQRHLNDLDHAGERGFYYDQAEAQNAIDFFEEVLCLAGGDFEGKPFILLSWQCFIVGSIFGWKRYSDDKRRFRLVYVETGKGSGKSPICAGVGIKGLVADKEARAEIYAAATDKDQAAVLFRDAIAFYDQSPELQIRLSTSGGSGKEWMLSHLDSNSFFRIVSSENNKSGFRPHMALLDEIHEHKDGTVIKMLRAGFKFRSQPLQFMITNSGHDNTTVCWEYHESGRKVACEFEENDEFFAYICSLDDADLIDEKYLEDETCWIKANPSIDAGLPGYPYIRGMVKEARGIPSNMSTVKRLNFCIWTESENPWLDKETWMSCKDEDFDMELLKGRRAWGGLDLSRVNDLTSWSLIFEPSIADTYWRLLTFFWVPGVGITKKAEQDKVPYDVWRDRGFIFAPPVKTVKKSYVARFMKETQEIYNIQGTAYDRAMINDFVQAAQDEGVTLVEGKWIKESKRWDFGNQEGIRIMPFGQEARSMHPAIEKFEGMLKNGELRHIWNPALNWCIANAVVKEIDHYRRISKTTSTGRVDGAITAVMACGVAAVQQVGSVYDGLSKEEILERMRA
jgi:phage terminase large subunit-like protein